MLSEEKMIDWEEKLDTDKIWANWKTYFKNIYVIQKRHNKGTGRKIGFEIAANVTEKHIFTEDSIYNIFE